MNWTPEVWVAFITVAGAIVTAAFALLKPTSKDEPTKAPVILMRFDAEHVPTARALDNIQRIADGVEERRP